MVLALRFNDMLEGVELGRLPMQVVIELLFPGTIEQD